MYVRSSDFRLLYRPADFIQFADEPNDHDFVEHQLVLLSWLQKYVYGRNRRITFHQLIRREWCQYPLPYNRYSVRVPTPDWIESRQKKLIAFRDQQR